MNEVTKPSTIAHPYKLSASSPTPSSTTATEPVKAYREKSSSPHIPASQKSASPPSTPREKKRKRSVKKKGSLDSFLHKITTSCSLFFHRIRVASEEVLSNDKAVKDLFVTSSDSSMDGMSGIILKKPLSEVQSPEERFLEEFKAQKSLERIYNNRRQQQKQHEPSAEETRLLLQKILKDSSSSVAADGRPLLTISTLRNIDTIPFAELDFCGMRKQFEEDTDSEGNTLDGSSNMTSPLAVNIGETLWNYRRGKWLNNDLTEEQIHERTHNNLIDGIPQELFPMIYSNLVNKNKTLKTDKRMNLGDLVQVINAGWISEDKWERAAKGLA